MEIIYTLIRINHTHSHAMFHPGIYVYFFLDPTFAFAPVAYVLLLAAARPQFWAAWIWAPTWGFERNHKIGDVWYQTRLLDLEIWIILSHSHIHFWSFFLNLGQAENARAGVAVSGILQAPADPFFARR